MTTTMDVETRRQKASKLFEDLKGLMCNLASRWLDEREYEDIKDYQKVLEPHITAIGGAILKMTKRPFGFHYSLGGKVYVISVTTRQYSYKCL